MLSSRDPGRQPNVTRTHAKNIFKDLLVEGEGIEF